MPVGRTKAYIGEVEAACPETLKYIAYSGPDEFCDTDSDVGSTVTASDEAALGANSTDCVRDEEPSDSMRPRDDGVVEDGVKRHSR
jgi:hypothetical protein